MNTIYVSIAYIDKIFTNRYQKLKKNNDEDELL